jgi:hypothetical protein
MNNSGFNIGDKVRVRGSLRRGVVDSLLVVSWVNVRFTRLNGKTYTENFSPEKLKLIKRAKVTN